MAVVPEVWRFGADRALAEVTQFGQRPVTLLPRAGNGRDRWIGSDADHGPTGGDGGSRPGSPYRDPVPRPRVPRRAARGVPRPQRGAGGDLHPGARRGPIPNGSGSASSPPTATSTRWVTRRSSSPSSRSRSRSCSGWRWRTRAATRSSSASASNRRATRSTPSASTTSNRPFNPMVNAGAIVSTGLIDPHDGLSVMDRIVDVFSRYVGPGAGARRDGLPVRER